MFKNQTGLNFERGYNKILSDEKYYAFFSVKAVAMNYGGLIKLVK